jgi:orotate phosphoribosyltransferase
MIRAAGATPCGVAIALDRQERATDERGGAASLSAVQYVQRELALPVVAIATLEDLLGYLASNRDASLAAHHERVLAYRQRYGV